jgi:F-type H+-transporting ATPase subunit gamma
VARFREIRKRILGIKKTQKITRAMKLVSAAKFSRAQGAIQAARPYAQKLAQVLASVASGVESDAHPLLTARTPVRKVDVVVFTSDRGLCGAYNTNIVKYAERMIAKRRPEVESISIISVGRKGGDLLRSRRAAPVAHRWTGLTRVEPAMATEIAQFLTERYLSGAADEVVLVYSEFVSALTQRPGAQVLLPLKPPAAAAAGPVYSVEPGPEQLLSVLVPRAVEFAVFRALLENQAGEHGARMTAMESATSNTTELIRSYTLDFNKARQAAITAELVEIVSGAEAL